jgi:hypothetical protein
MAATRCSMWSSVPRLWLDLDGMRQSCHSWRCLDGRRISAMATILLLLALITLTAWLGARLYDWLRTDGLGHRTPPPSHRDWTEGTDPYLH